MKKKVWNETFSFVFIDLKSNLIEFMNTIAQVSDLNGAFLSNFVEGNKRENEQRTRYIWRIGKVS